MSSALLVDLYELTMAQSYFIYKKNVSATFDLFVRRLPPRRSYLIACGLEDSLHYLAGLRFTDDDIAYLRRLKLFTDDFLAYLRKFRFSGDVYGVPEGAVCFADEPILRITAPVIEAQIVESCLLNTVHVQTMIASKASRVHAAAQGRPVYDFSLRRTHGSDAAVKAARSSYIAGCSATSNCLAGSRYQIPVAGTMAHSFVMSFQDELDSFLAYAGTFPRHTILLVDTYDTIAGIRNAVITGLYLREKGCRLQGIRLDSGDIIALSRRARAELDNAGLSGVKIIASGNLDEYKVRAIVRSGAPVDGFGVGTAMGTSDDTPSLDVIYKISEVTGADGKFLPTMKLSANKATYPGRKQVFRIRDRGGKFIKDIVGLEAEGRHPERAQRVEGLEGERIPAEALLKKYMESGALVRKLPSTAGIRSYAARQISSFGPGLMSLDRRYPYPVTISKELKKLRAHLLKNRR